ncbi:MAG: glyceraldehyde-3-phosphate dehydrogenase [Propionibacteriaceae bacterium]
MPNTVATTRQTPPTPEGDTVAGPSWTDREAAAEIMVALIGRLFRSHGVITSVYGRSLVNQPVRTILKIHRFARQIDGAELPTENTLALLETLSRLDLAPALIDLGEINRAYHESDATNLEEFLRAELAPVVGSRQSRPRQRTDVVLYGFGRIGRLLARLMIENAAAGDGLNLRAVVVRQGPGDDLTKRASLLRRDTVHGPFEGSITVDRGTNTIVANGTPIQVIYASDPATVDFTTYGIHDALLVDNTGRWRDRAGLAQHLAAPGIARVLLTAPGKGDLKNVVHGINHQTLTPADTLVSAASCTTNAITPALKVINDRFGIVHGHVETVHSFTNDQNLTDNVHPGNRRGRAATLNLVIAETGAAKAVAKALPELAGKLTGNSIRVPTPNVSLAILNLTLGTETDRDELNTHLRHMALHSALRRQIAYTDSPEVVSSDFLGTPHTGIIDGLATICTGTNAVVYVWYDNEYGYSCQVLRVMEQMAGAQRPSFPAAAKSCRPPG